MNLGASVDKASSYFRNICWAALSTLALGLMYRTVPSNCGNSRRRYRGRSDTDNSSMSRVQSCSRTITVLHQRCWHINKHPAFLILFLDGLVVAIKPGEHPNLVINVPQSATFFRTKSRWDHGASISMFI